MPKKLTIDDIRLFLAQNDATCELLSTEYKNVSTPLMFKCECGNHFERTAQKLKSGKAFYCPSCSQRMVGDKYRHSIEHVRSVCDSLGLTLLSDSYANGKEKLRFRCSCGNEFVRTFLKVQGGQTQCSKCANQRVAESRRYPLEEVKAALAEKGYTVKDDEYKNDNSCIPAVCGRGHNLTINFSAFLLGHSGCRACANQDKTGIGHPRYKDGRSKLIEKLRNLTGSWIEDIKLRDNHTCFVTGRNDELNVHHFNSFRGIVDKVLSDMGLEFHKKIERYNQDELIEMSYRFAQEHSRCDGVTITDHAHRLFHVHYGDGDTTWAQMQEFKSRYLSGEFDK